MTDLMEKLRLVKTQADSAEQDRLNYQAYVADRVEHGWTKHDVKEYRQSVADIMSGEDDDAKAAAREFWALKRVNPEKGVNPRIRQAIEAKRMKEAA